ncbi:hypothetical protein QL285_072675 [Trifolium repens]|nr:hypothetical protein QL285_072675 [Trifolium repens]
MKYHILNTKGPTRLYNLKPIAESSNVRVKQHRQTNNLRHPRKDRTALALKPWQRRKLLGGHCECFEKQALDLSSLINSRQHSTIYTSYSIKN